VTFQRIPRIGRKKWGANPEEGELQGKKAKLKTTGVKRKTRMTAIHYRMDNKRGMKAKKGGGKRDLEKQQD